MKNKAKGAYKSAKNAAKRAYNATKNAAKRAGTSITKKVVKTLHYVSDKKNATRASLALQMAQAPPMIVVEKSNLITWAKYIGAIVLVMTITISAYNSLRKGKSA